MTPKFSLLCHQSSPINSFCNCTEKRKKQNNCLWCKGKPVINVPANKKACIYTFLLLSFASSAHFLGFNGVNEKCQTRHVGTPYPAPGLSLPMNEK